MRRCTWLLLASGMLVACGTQSTDPAASPSDAAPAAPGVIADAALPSVTSDLTDAAGADTPGGAAEVAFGSEERTRGTVPAETAASDAVLQLLEDEGLLVLDLNSSVRVDDDGSTAVLVRVLFGTGRSHPHQEAYRVQLVEDAGDWAVLDLEVAR